MKSHAHALMLRTPLICYVAMLVCCACVAQAGCGVEAKVLIAPSQTEATVAALHAGKATAGQVYLFDTSSLDLLSQGVVVRVRKGSADDVMVKVRQPEHKAISEPSVSHENFKCEVDVVGDEEQTSYSILNKLGGREVPKTGAELFGLLSSAQKDLLKQARTSTDWSLVKRSSVIESKSWRVKGQPPLNALALEPWRWPGGQVLELSTKAGAGSGSTVRSQLQQLVTEKRLALSRQQQFKTTLVLHGITKSK